MNAVNAEQLIITPEDYLSGENLSDIRHEYVDGDIYAMAGGSDAHARISGNAFFLLKTHLRGSGCSTYLSDMKVQASDTQYFYPDVLVTCDAADRKENYSKRAPVLIIEVLSHSTEGYDRGKKFEYYRQMESLQEYVLIDQSDVHVDVFRKNAQQRWELFSFSKPEKEVCLDSVKCCLSFSALYEDVDFKLAEGEQTSH